MVSSSVQISRLRIVSTYAMKSLGLLKFLLACLLLPSIGGKMRNKFLDPFPMNGHRHSECFVNDTGGLCLFSWECQNIGGQSLGLCREGMIFGSCCTTPSIINPLTSVLTLPSGYVFPLQKKEVIQQECGRSSSSGGEFDSRIVNGVKTNYGEFPWQASLRIVTPFPITLAWCGAVILTPSWVITAAHCVQNFKTQDFVVRFGIYSIVEQLDPSPLVERQAEKIIIHPEFTILSRGHDIALIKVSEPIEFNKVTTSPICLPGNDVGDLHDVKAVISGWGKGQQEDDFPVFLRKAVVPILKNQDCQKMYRKENKIIKVTPNFICAGYQAGGTDSCQGDSGGPLQVLGEDGRWFLAGVTSSGYMCAKPNLPGLYTRISLYVPWILKHTSS